VPPASEMSEKFDVGKRVSATISPLHSGSASTSIVDVSQMAAAVELMPSTTSGYNEPSSNLFQNHEPNPTYQENFFDCDQQAMGARLESIEQNAYLKGEADGDENHDEDGPLKLFVGQVSE
jgi:hypothetical protein